MVLYKGIVCRSSSWQRSKLLYVDFTLYTRACIESVLMLFDTDMNPSCLCAGKVLCSQES